MSEGSAAVTAGKVLAAGVYAAAEDRRVAQLVGELSTARRASVEQRWVGLGLGDAPLDLAPVTVSMVREPRPRFELLNELLGGIDLGGYDLLLVCDDDVTLPEGFLDRYLELVARHDLALAQPAHAHGSVVENAIVEQMDGLDARLTRFVEAGPLFSIRRDAFRVLLPFDEGSPFGWGYEVVWPVAMEAAGLRMGIVDATPVTQHPRRAAPHAPPVEWRARKAFLDKRPHVSRAEAFTILEAYA